MKKLLLVLSIIALIVALILYLGQKGKIKMRDDPQAMKQEVLKKVPIGSRGNHIYGLHVVNAVEHLTAEHPQ